MNRPCHRRRRRRPVARRLPSPLAAVAALAPTPSLAADACSARSAATVAAGGRALHLRGLQLLPAGRPLAVEAQGRPGRGRARLPRRLLGPARLEGPLRQRRLHRPPGGAAGEQRRALQLHAAGRRRRPGPQGLAGHRHAARQSPGGAGRRRCWRARRPGHRDRRRRRPLAEAARRLLGGHRAGPRHRRQGRREPGRDAAARLRGARLPDRCRPGRRAAARRRPSPSSCRRAPTRRRIRARSTSSSSTPTAAGRCRR